MPSTSARFARTLVIALVLTSAAVVVSEEAATEEYGYPTEDVDRTDFTEEHLKTDKVIEATIPHSDIEVSWIFPESPDSKLPVGGTTDLLVALANGGAKMFNVSRVEARLNDASGSLAIKLPRIEYGQSLGPHEQRSFRYPLTLEKEAVQKEYTLVAKVFYNTRDKEPFVSPIVEETVELVPPLPTSDMQRVILQMVLFAIGVLIFGITMIRSAIGPEAKAKASKKAKAASEAVGGNEWLAGTLAGTEGRKPKKTKVG